VAPLLAACIACTRKVEAWNRYFCHGWLSTLTACIACTIERWRPGPGVWLPWVAPHSNCMHFMHYRKVEARTRYGCHVWLPSSGCMQFMTSNKAVLQLYCPINPDHGGGRGYASCTAAPYLDKAFALRRKGSLAIHLLCCRKMEELVQFS
jgi:hypothetical protein